MKVKDHPARSLHVLSDSDLIKHGAHLVGIGTLRRAVVGEGPGTAADLERVSHDRRALGAFAKNFSLESDGAVYAHRRELYLWLLPTMTIPQFDLHRCSVLEFFEGISRFQNWIDAKEQVIATGAQKTPSKERSNEQRKAVEDLDSIELKLGDGLVAAYKCWVKEWVSNRTIKYTISHHGHKSIEVRVPPRISVVPDLDACANTALGEQGRTNEIKGFRPVLLVRTATGMTMRIEISNNAAHLKIGHGFYYSAPSQDHGNQMYIYKAEAE